MKKILRLVTTSVLTLTLVACGEASSSVASSTPVSSSVSSPVTSTFAAVTRIDLSAATDSLTQVLGAQKAVVVTATLSANANPATPVEWFVDGAKSNQTGRVFEFTPAKAGTFVISARVGSVNSTSTVSVVVGVPAFKVETAKFTDNKTIEIKAPAGASVAVTGNELLAESRYDIVKGTYFLNLKTALKQGDSATVTFTTESGTVTEVVTFDTRAIDIAVAGGAKDNKDGTYTIVRPHEINPTSEVLNTVNNTYTVTFQSTNLGGTQLPFKLEQVSVPTGATAIAVSEGLINVATTAKASASSLTFNVTRSTIIGSYVFKYTLNGISKNVTLIVEDTEAEIKLAEFQNGTVAFNFSTFVKDDAGTVGTTANVFPIYASEADIGSPATKASTAKFNFLYRPGTQLGLVGVVPNAAGEFEITKDYLPTATAFKEFAFKLSGELFRVPTNLNEQAGVLPNQALISVSGPGGSPLMRTQYTTQVALPTLSSGFRDNFNLDVVRQKVDASTPEGKYTYTLRVLQLGVEIMREEVVVVVKAPAQASTITAKLNDAGDAFDDVKVPEFAARVSRLAPIFPAAADIDAAAVVVASTGYGIARDAFIKHLIDELPLPTVISGFNYDSYLAARTAWVNIVTSPTDGKIKFAGGATPSALFAASPDYGTLVTTPNDNQLKAILDVFGAYNTGSPATSSANSGAVVVSTAIANTQAAYLSLFDDVLVSVKAFLNVAPALTSIDTQAEYDVELAKFKARVALLYPSYQEFVNNGVVTADFKAGADGVYVIEKPFELTKDSKSLVFELNLTNFEGAISPAALVANSYLDGSTKRELLPYIRTVTGPVLLPNHALNNLTTKVAIELNASGTAAQVDDTITTQEQPTSNTYARYRAASHSSSETAANKVVVPNVAIIDVDFLTPTGDYIFNVSLGSVSKIISVKVVNPTPKINFGLISTDGLVFDSDDNGADSAVKQFTYNAAEDKYYGKLGRTAANNDRLGFKIGLSIENVKPGTTGLPYSFTLTTPDTVVTRTDVVAVTELAGNDAKYRITNAGTAPSTFGDIANLIVTDLVAPRPNTQFVGTAGTYIYDLTLGGVRKAITLVVEAYPTIKDTVVNVGTAKADVFGTRALIPSGTKAFTVAGASSNLPTGTLYYTLSIGTSVDDNLKATNRLGTTAAANGSITSTELFKPLSLASIPVQLVTDGTSTSDFGFATDADLVNKVRFVQINLFSRVNVASFNPLVPRYDLIHVGHETVEIWYAPNNVPTSIITSSQASLQNIITAIKLPVVSDSPGTVFFQIFVGTHTAPTAEAIVNSTAQGSVTAGSLAKPSDNDVALSGSAAPYTATLDSTGTTTLIAGTAYTFYWVVVGANNISQVRSAVVTARAELGTTLATGAVTLAGVVTDPNNAAGGTTLRYYITPVADSGINDRATAITATLTALGKSPLAEVEAALGKAGQVAAAATTVSFSATKPTVAVTANQRLIIIATTGSGATLLVDAVQVITPAN